MSLVDAIDMLKSKQSIVIKILLLFTFIIQIISHNMFSQLVHISQSSYEIEQMSAQMSELWREV